MYFSSFQNAFKTPHQAISCFILIYWKTSSFSLHKNFLMHRKGFSSISWCFTVHFTHILTVLLNVKEGRWHITVFLALCSWSLSILLQDQRTVHVKAMLSLPVRCFISSKKSHIVVAAFSKQESKFMQSIIFSVPLPLKEIYPSWNCHLIPHNLDFLFQQDRFKSQQPLHHLAAENFCCYEFWNISANSNDAIASWLPVTSRYQQQPVVATLSDSRHKISEGTSIAKKTGAPFAPPL